MRKANQKRNKIAIFSNLYIFLLAGVKGDKQNAIYDIKFADGIVEKTENCSMD